MIKITANSRPHVPKGFRVYAVGDIHGRADLLAPLMSRIDADAAARPEIQSLRIFLGDYIDRGPESRTVIDLLIAYVKKHRTVCLKGNHEGYFLEVLKNPAIIDDWRRYGGYETLMSYGVQPTIELDKFTRNALAADFGSAIPAEHMEFVASLRTSFTCGDYFFVHAGVRPRIPLASQREEDLLWIRDDFLLYEQDFTKVIVHGHTPVLEPDVRPNRINIDTGAFATGRLTCLKLEDDRIEFI